MQNVKNGNETTSSGRNFKEIYLQLLNLTITETASALLVARKNLRLLSMAMQAQALIWQ
jgi:hypothetical protein